MRLDGKTHSIAHWVDLVGILNVVLLRATTWENPSTYMQEELTLVFLTTIMKLFNLKPGFVTLIRLTKTHLDG